ncbi:MAG: Type I phosphodiesterase / nucleotide pyrophosphatase [Planctomycetes bacterium ADurb.Bin126]|nr:MAG: Type I phosphodiesterase / nucleotide pyrophosphatase [Planctomycetes bacterium ADurb.Bin126]HOD83535.1 alkaline phosphatase family protein [Phycisphaerae bacterium]HQL73441.1 alkaline phosphatase family protein [Phycisphaerae bacterium]
MKRLCLINVAGLSPRVLAEGSPSWLDRLAGRPRAMRPLLPATPACMQACMTTGVRPEVHGVVADTLYRRGRGEISLCERSNTLLSKKRFWHSRRLAQRPKVALAFWTQPLAGAADVVLGAMTACPGPPQPPDQPHGLYERIAERIGPFDDAWLWGAAASCRAAEWTAQAACEIWREQRPDLMCVHLAGLDAELVRHGLGSPQAAEALRLVENAAARVSQAVGDDGAQTLVVSDGPFVNVSRAARPNLRLRQAGLLVHVEEGGRVRLDLARTRAFAMVQHQVAHLYCADEASAIAATRALEGEDGLAGVVPRQEVFPQGAGYYRSGEYLLLAESDAYLACSWLDEQETASGWGQQLLVDCCGCDTCEWLAPSPGRPPAAVRASRGLVHHDPLDQCLLAGTCELPGWEKPSVLDVPQIAREAMGI